MEGGRVRGALIILLDLELNDFGFEPVPRSNNIRVQNRNQSQCTTCEQLDSGLRVTADTDSHTVNRLYVYRCYCNINIERTLNMVIYVQQCTHNHQHGGYQANETIVGRMKSGR